MSEKNDDRKNAIRASLSAFLTPEAVRQIANDQIQPMSFSTGWIYCLLCQVRDHGDHSIIASHLDATSSIILKHRGMLVGGVASIILGGFGMLGGAQDQFARQGTTASEEMLNKMGSNIRIVSFSGDASFGMLGNEWKHYGALINSFADVLSVLLNTEYGKSTNVMHADK